MMRALFFFSVLALVAGCDSKSAKPDGGAVGVKSAAPPSSAECGGKFGPCTPGEVCHYDSPGCDATGHCGGPDPVCAHATAFCGCSAMEFACTYPKRAWREKGPQCITNAAYGIGPAPSDAPAPSASASGDAGRR